MELKISNEDRDQPLAIFWFRRDLRLHDNTGLLRALGSGTRVLPIFIFDEYLVSGLPGSDHRITFIYDSLANLNLELSKHGSSLLVAKGKPAEIFKRLTETFRISSLYYNRDYEPYAKEREAEVKKLLDSMGIASFSSKDQVIFEHGEIMKPGGGAYTVYTPYMKRWMSELTRTEFNDISGEEKLFRNFRQMNEPMPSLGILGFKRSDRPVKEFEPDHISDYEKYRDIPFLDRTTFAGPHLRFGTISIRELVRRAANLNIGYLRELAWREFFMQILATYPHVVDSSFKPAYDRIRWHNDDDLFRRWCNGETGYPMVDAGMRELLETGYMHNRIRMVTASFLCKHLLIDWRLGERWFAEKLFDYELSSNNGNWQWAAGTGCDAAPWFRVFNPELQRKKFDPENRYIRKWIPELETGVYPSPVVEHRMARERAIEAYRKALKG